MKLGIALFVIGIISSIGAVVIGALYGLWSLAWSIPLSLIYIISLVLIGLGIWLENPTNPLGDWWVDTIGAANFTLNGVDPGASNLDFYWEAKVR